MDVFTAVVEDVALSGDDDGGGLRLVGDIDGRVCRCSDRTEGKIISTSWVLSAGRVGTYTVGATVMVAVGVLGDMFTAALQKGAP